MQSIADMALKPDYPCVHWQEGLMFRAREPRELCVHSRRRLEKSREIARAGAWHLIDPRGRYFDIGEWERVAPFGGLNVLPDILLGRIFAAPVLINQKQLTLDEFKKVLEHVAKERYRYDIEPYDLDDILEKLPHAKSYVEAIGALPKLL